MFLLVFDIWGVYFVVEVNKWGNYRNVYFDFIEWFFGLFGVFFSFMNNLWC